MKRRSFIETTLAGGALTGLAGAGAMSCGPAAESPKALNRRDVTIRETGKYDLLLKGGHVIDPANGINAPRTDVALSGGTVAAVGTNIPETEAKKTLDVSGLYVTPGFVDIHAHVFYTDPNPSYRWVAADDLCFPSCVTTVMDPGSSGLETFENLKKIIDKSKTRTFALVNISCTGMDGGEQNPRMFKVEPLVDLARQYPDYITGFKTAHYWTNRPYDELHTPWASVDALVEAGNKADLPVMLDFFPRPASDGYPARSYRELILEKARPGDIHTHNFARHFPVIMEDGTVNPDLFKAQERGFIFDVGHGAGSFVFRNAVPAIAQGFLPNSISTDLHCFNTCGPVVNMANVMSKFINIGVSLEDVIRLSTVNPAREIKHPELGTLTVGNTGDVAVFDIIEGQYDYADTSAGKIHATKKIFPMMTIASGSIVFDPYGFSVPYWEDIPVEHSYWQNPSGQYY